MWKVVLVLFGLCLSSSAVAHGGGLDASGCHHDRKRGGYHCHRDSAATTPRSMPSRRVIAPPVELPAPYEEAEQQPFLTPVAATTSTSVAALAEPITGVPQVLDGDTIQIGTTRIRLFGIDAFEGEQMCEGPGSQRYGCGGKATRALTELIAAEFTVCVPKGTDVYGRLLAICRVKTIDLSAAMARQGHALAYVKYALDYVFEEQQAKQERAGAWAGSFVPPWEFRTTRASGAAEAQRAAQAPSSDCTIKGNVNAKGDRIYHLEGTRDYVRTKPENWFCSVDEAEKAGFRKAGSPH